MRALFFAVLCIFMVGYIAADDLILGERQTGDYVFTNRTIFKPAIPWVRMTATINVKATSGDIITQIKLTNIEAKKADFRVIRGGVGTPRITVWAIGKRGEGLCVRVEGFAINPLITTEAPTTTEPTIAPTTTTTKRPETTHVPTEPSKEITGRTEGTTITIDSD